MITIDSILKDIYIDSPLYGEIMINCTRVEDPTLPFMAAVTPRLQLMINPILFDKLTLLERRAVIIHEILHVMMLHFSRLKEEFEKHPTITNYAMDCAINQLIPNLPKDCVTLDTIKKLTGDNTVEPLKSAEYYYKLLMKAYNQFKDKMDKMMSEMGEGNSQGHSEMFKDDLNVFEKTFLEDVIERAVEKQKLHDMKRGTSTANEVLSVIPMREKCIDKKIWKGAVNKFFQEEPKGNHEYRYGRQSRQNVNSMFGKVRILESSHIYVGLDNSGSVSNEDLTKFVAQINAGMKSTGTTATIIQCDTQVKDVKTLSRIPTNGFKVTGRGGTNLTKILDWIKANRPASEKVSNLLLLTDGETDWYDDSTIKTTAIYTKQHTKIPSIQKYAILY